MNTSASSNMMIGGLIFLAGLGITAVSLASSANGGVVIVTWGAMLFGVIQFFRGLFQSFSGSRVRSADQLIEDVTDEVRIVIAVAAGLVRNPVEPSEREIGAIQATLRYAASVLKYTVLPIRETLIRDVALAMAHEPGGVAGYVWKKNRYLTPELRDIITEGASFVLRQENSDTEAASRLAAITDAMSNRKA